MKFDFAFVGKKKCGCVVALRIDYKEIGFRDNELKDDIYEMLVHGGYSVERISLVEAKELLQECNHLQMQS